MWSKFKSSVKKILMHYVYANTWLDAYYAKEQAFKRFDELAAEWDKFKLCWDTAMHVMYLDDPPLEELRYCNEVCEESLLRRAWVLEDIIMYRERMEAINILERLND